MKVGVPPSPVAMAMPLPPRFGGDGERPLSDFAEMLAAMLGAGAQAAEARAAEFTPQIGSDGEAFERARLLVETALEFPNADRAPAAARVSEPLVAELPSPSLQRAQPSALQPAASAELVAHRLPYPLSSPPRAPDRVQTTPIAPAPARQSHAPPTPLASATGQTVRKDARLAGPEHPGTDTPQRATRPVSPFGAQVFAFEDGLRLLLKLPRLADGERAELETELARLLNDFGHRKHQIVIHEIAKGDS